MERTADLFWRLLEPEYVRANGFCRRLAGSRDDGDDLFQEALLKALNRFSELRDPEAFRPWFYRIVMNCHASHHRRWWNRHRVEWTDELENSMTGPDPADRHAARRWLSRIMAGLSRQQQVLVTLHEIEQWPLAEIATMTGLPESALKVRLYRARQRMKKAPMKFMQESG